MGKPESNSSKQGVAVAVGFLCMIILVFFLFFNGCLNQEDTSPTQTSGVDSLQITVEVTPVWSDAVLTDSPDINSVAQVFQLLWDRSIPIGGYVHSTNPDSQFALQRIHESLMSSRLTSDYGGRESSLECMVITDLLSPVDCNSRLSRDFFDGGQSRMDQAIEYLVSGLKSGTIMGAALITDMMTTSDFGIGATALLPHFKDPLLRGLFNEGAIHVAILGIRIPYWYPSENPYHCGFASPVTQYLQRIAQQKPDYRTDTPTGGCRVGRVRNQVVLWDAGLMRGREGTGSWVSR